MLHVGFYQFRPLFGRIQYNLKKIVNVLDKVSADIIVLPELPFTGYYFKDRQELKTMAEEINGSNIVECLVSLCRDRDFYLVSGFAEKFRDKYFNSALLIGPEGIIRTYRKIHLFNEEKHWFDPGDTPLRVDKIRGVNVGLMVCFDWIFPEIFRALSLLGADIICHPSNLVLSYCQQTMITRCLENAVFAITANRFGTDKRPQGNLTFTGKSQVVAPKGDLLFRASSHRETLHIQEIDISLARNKNMTPLNDLFNDRRSEFYDILCR